MPVPHCGCFEVLDDLFDNVDRFRAVSGTTCVRLALLHFPKLIPFAQVARGFLSCWFIYDQQCTCCGIVDGTVCNNPRCRKQSQISTTEYLLYRLRVDASCDLTCFAGFLRPLSLNLNPKRKTKPSALKRTISTNAASRRACCRRLCRRLSHALWMSSSKRSTATTLGPILLLGRFGVFRRP